jgi:hypothetical protein
MRLVNVFIDRSRMVGGEPKPERTVVLGEPPTYPCRGEVECFGKRHGWCEEMALYRAEHAVGTAYFGPACLDKCERENRFSRDSGWTWFVLRERKRV